MLKREIREKIFQNALSLEEYGINGLAWSMEDAKKLINEIMKDKIGILGGDVYKVIPKRLESLSDNWFCEPKNSESEEQFYSRSKLESLKYIENYPIELGETIIFAI